MENNKVNVLKYLTNLCFFLYFLVLFGERVSSIILSFVNKVNILDGYFHIFTYFLTFLSLAGTLIYLLFKCRNHFKGLFTRNSDTYEKIDFVHLSIASGILLLSGMVHTEYSISGIQFASYAFLIIAILFKVIETNKTSENKVSLWLSFAYLVAFSMSIPVMYEVSGKMMIPSYIASSLAVLVLVCIFTLLTIKVFKGEGNELFSLVPFIVMIALSGSVLILRNPHEGNLFVLIFIITTAVIYIIYLVYAAIGLTKNSGNK